MHVEMKMADKKRNGPLPARTHVELNTPVTVLMGITTSSKTDHLVRTP